MTGDAAIIGLLGAILGIVLSNIFVALLEKRRREERRKDIVCALHAEILAGIGASQRQLCCYTVWRRGGGQSQTIGRIGPDMISLPDKMPQTHGRMAPVPMHLLSIRHIAQTPQKFNIR